MFLKVLKTHAYVQSASQIRGFKEQNHFALVILYILEILFYITFTNDKNIFLEIILNFLVYSNSIDMNYRKLKV